MDDLQEILNHLPHRYPFLMVDRVVQFESGKSLTAIKNVTFNEPIFSGHFPQSPVFPGVLMVEAMGQAGILLAFKSFSSPPGKKSLPLLVGIDKTRYKRQVIPGDQLLIDVVLRKEKRGIWFFEASAKVEGVLACSSEILIARNETDK